MIYFFPESIQKALDVFFKYNEINYLYNSIYYNSFLNAIKEVNEQNIKKEIQSNQNILLKTWFENMDREFEEKLRSDNFINLLTGYFNSSLDLYHDIYRTTQLLKQYHDIFDFYLKYFYSPLISYSKELNLSAHEIIFQKESIKLLHYIDNNNQQQTKGFENNTCYLLFTHPLTVFIF